LSFDYLFTKVKRILLSLIFITVITAIANNSNNIRFVNSEIAATPATYSQQSNDSIVTRDANNNIPYVGVNVQGLYVSLEGSRGSSQSINRVHFPTNYYDDSFRIISKAGMNHVRFIFYWEAYEKHPAEFIKELTTVAQTADKYRLKVMYDNHQFHTSSWLDNKRGTGFPASLFKNYPTLYPYNGGGSTEYPAAKVWWTNWWNRSVKDVGTGVDGWTLQANFLKKIAGVVDSHPSTIGYEILSEPQLHSTDQWGKIGTYNTFMVNQLRTQTHKTIAYSMNIPIDLKNSSITPTNLAEMAPSNRTNVVFKISVYAVPAEGNYQQKRLDLFIKAARLAGVPLYIGEWNNVRRVQVPITDQNQHLVNQTFTTSPQLSDISQEQADLIVQKLKEIKVWGMAFWSWDYTYSPVPSFNLIKVLSDLRDLTGTIQTTKYFDILKNAYSTIYDNNIDIVNTTKRPMRS
jgi:Cellulase (glycosyl hydrolase family 5)